MSGRRIIRLTDWSGNGVLVNVGNVSHVTEALSRSDGIPICTVWLGSEYGDSGLQGFVDVRGTLDDVQTWLNDGEGQS